MTNATRLAGVLTFTLIVAAFVLAIFTQGNGSMSLTPPPTEADPNPVPDIGSALTLHRAAYTAWAALLLIIPAFVAYPLRKASERAFAVWRPFWTGAYVAYAVHILYCMHAFFAWDFTWMQNTSRVAAFWPGMIVLIWWPIDIALAWAGAVGRVVDIQRLALTTVLFVLFVGGSAATGEMLIVRLIGGALFLAMMAALMMRYLRPKPEVRSGATQ